MRDREYYLDNLRNNEKKLILELEELIFIESMSFYRDKGIHWLSAPVTTGTISSPMGLGSDSLPVEIYLDGRKTYLADSMQFLLEYGCRLFKNGCWYIMPTFRGEDVDKRHLKQFFHSEAEVPGNLDDTMNLVNEYIKHLLRKIQVVIGDQKHLNQVIEHDIPRVTFDEAEKILGRENIEHRKTWRNLTRDNEQKLIEYFGGPVWVMHYDEDAVPFYQRSINGKAQNADLLMGIGETVGCGERWSSGVELEKALSHYGHKKTEYEWYVKLKNYQPLQTSGFGMGIERFLLFVLKKNDIRDIQVFRRFNDGGDIV